MNLLDARKKAPSRFIQAKKAFLPVLIALLSPFVLFSGTLASVRVEVLAEVNQAKITDKTLEVEVRAYLRKIGHQELSPLRMAAVKKNALKKLIEEELLYQEGLRLQEQEDKAIGLSSEEIEAGVQEIRDRFSSEAVFRASLLKEGLDLEDLRKGVARALLIRKTWSLFSEMAPEGRRKRLKTLSEHATIRIHAQTPSAGGALSGSLKPAHQPARTVSGK